MTPWQALAVTLACETPVLLLLARRHGLPPARVALAAISANCLTHPAAWRIATVLTPAEYRAGLWWIEGGVVLAEALWYWSWLRTGMPAALLYSLLANAASLGIGWRLW